MKKIKLLTLTSRNYVLAFLAMLILLFCVFYLILRMEVRHNVDEILLSRKNNIIKIFESENGRIPIEAFGYSDFIITPVNASIPDTYTDTLIFETRDQEFDEYRKLVSSFNFGGSIFRIEIVKTHLESGEIIHSVLMVLASIFLFMLGMFYFTTYSFSGRTWKPFYKTLARLKEFDPENPERIAFDKSRIEEFDTLNRSLSELTDRVQHSFVSQKQFIENAAHEMQTPLAIIQNQLELLIADPDLTEFQSKKITRVLDSTQRITKLNKALQLISKIENSQFIDIEKCNVKTSVEKVLAYFDDHQENIKIRLDLHLQDVVVSTNATLLDVLITNLVKNAFLHNVDNGSVRINLAVDRFEITNTSRHSELPREKLFQRFFKQGQNKESWGLGLAIAKRISDINSWRLSYSPGSMTHTFTVFFIDKNTT